MLIPGEHFSLHADGRTGDATGVSVSYLKLYEEVRRGMPSCSMTGQSSWRPTG